MNLRTLSNITTAVSAVIYGTITLLCLIYGALLQNEAVVQVGIGFAILEFRATWVMRDRTKYPYKELRNV